MAIEIRARLFTLDFPDQVVHHDVGLVMGHAAGLGGGHVGGVADDVHVLEVLGLQGVFVRIHIAHGVAHTGIDDHLLTEVRWNGHQQVIGHFLAGY